MSPMNASRMIAAALGWALLALPVALAVAKGDNATRHLLEEQLTDEEEHAAWLESQLELIRQMGLENYLSTQV